MKYLKFFEDYKYRMDEHGKNIVWENDDFFIAVNSMEDVTYVSLWDKELKKRIGSLGTSSDMYFHGKTWRKIDAVDIEPKYRGKGMGKLMYQVLIKYLKKDISGLVSYLPDRANKKQIPAIYKRFKNWEEGDYHFIERIPA